jgi:hypothetical protein
LANSAGSIPEIPIPNWFYCTADPLASTFAQLDKPL